MAVIAVVLNRTTGSYVLVRGDGDITRIEEIRKIYGKEICFAESPSEGILKVMRYSAEQLNKNIRDRTSALGELVGQN